MNTYKVTIFFQCVVLAYSAAYAWVLMPALSAPSSALLLALVLLCAIGTTGLLFRWRLPALSLLFTNAVWLGLAASNSFFAARYVAALLPEFNAAALVHALLVNTSQGNALIHFGMLCVFLTATILAFQLHLPHDTQR